MTGGNNQWIDSRGNEEYTWPIAYRNAGELDPIISITVFGKPVNLVSYVDEGEIWVGYGLWPENGSDNAAELLAAGKLGEVSAWRQRAAYEEMQSSGRFQKIWTAGEMHGFYPGICLTTTEIIERELMGVGTASQDKNIPAID